MLQWAEVPAATKIILIFAVCSIFAGCLFSRTQQMALLSGAQKEVHDKTLAHGN